MPEDRANRYRSIGTLYRNTVKNISWSWTSRKWGRKSNLFIDQPVFQFLSLITLEPPCCQKTLFVFCLFFARRFQLSDVSGREWENLCCCAFFLKCLAGCLLLRSKYAKKQKREREREREREEEYDRDGSSGIGTEGEICLQLAGAGRGVIIKEAGCWEKYEGRWYGWVGIT